MTKGLIPMRLLGKLIKISFLTTLCFTAFIFYEEVNLLFHQLNHQDEGIISTDYNIDFTDGVINRTTNNKENINPDHDVKATPSRDDIEERYSDAFINFYDQAQKKVTELMQAAYNEYIQKKEQGEEISYIYFFTKYNRAAKSLEKATDEAFYTIFDSFVDELNTYGYDTEIAKDYKSTYENKKSSIRTSIMKEAAKKF